MVQLNVRSRGVIRAHDRPIEDDDDDDEGVGEGACGGCLKALRQYLGVWQCKKINVTTDICLQT